MLIYALSNILVAFLYFYLYRDIHGKTHDLESLYGIFIGIMIGFKDSDTYDVKIILSITTIIFAANIIVIIRK